MLVKIAPGLLVSVDQIPESLREQWRVNPLTHYWPQRPQEKFHKAIGHRVPVVAFFGGNQSGKTHCSIADDLIQALPREVIPEHLLPYKRWEPPFHMWIGCPKYRKLQEAIFPKIKELCPPAEFKGGSFEAAYKDKDALLRLECGSTIGFKTYDQDVDAYSSATLHRMHWDEEPPGEHGRLLRQEADARLLKFGGDEVLSMTPLLGLSWVYEDIYEKWERGDKNIFCVRADMDDNEYLDDEFKARYLSNLTTEEREARKEGKFVHFRGLVYPDYDEDKHLVDRPSIAHVQSQDTIVGIDPGVRTTGIIFTTFDRDNSLLAYDELYLHDQDTTPENAAQHIRDKCKEWGVDPLLYIIDPSARNRTPLTGEEVQQAYQRAGIPVLPGQASKQAGVFEIRRRMQHKPVPLISVSRNCTTLRWEIGRYRMDDRADGKFEVVKEDDHLVDPLRYVAMSRPIGPVGDLPDLKPFHYEPGTAPPADQLLTIAPSIDWDA